MTANKLALFKRGRVAAFDNLGDGVIDGGVYDGGGGGGGDEIQATEKMVDGIKKKGKTLQTKCPK